MSSAFFRFKQFTVWHDRCAMKVGTDGVLLGAWCPLSTLSTCGLQQTPRVLDVGTGSGLIAMMIAQRTNGHVHIDAIDIELDTVEQAMYNFAHSPWANILHVHHSTLQDWKAQKYDLIVSNPPYFQNSLKNPNTQRATARHTDSLHYDELIVHSAQLLQENGLLAMVLPIEAENEILSLGKQEGLCPTYITHVHPKPGKPAKRLLIALKRASESDICIPQTLYIESMHSPRSEEYQALTQNFYL